ncbi:hypothetical protein SAMN05216486_10728 [bacterium JGI 053]|nr:hypothetical protein SAMN05216486_10728 [bacterium JGI 053]
MESEFELIDLVAAVCEELDLPYAIGGSMASMTYGELRMTHDIDVVISLTAKDIPRFLARFPRPEYYHDEQAAMEAVRTGGQFNVILTEAALKIDVHVAADEIARRQLSRSRRLKSPSGRLANFSPPEELILMKMVYFEFSASEKQLRDITSMLRTAGSDIDLELVRTLAAAHGISHVWEAVQTRMERG